MLTAQRIARLVSDLGAAPEPPGLDAARSRKKRRAAGAYFTPPGLVSFVVREVLEARLARAADKPLVVLDPACGDGRFLVEAKTQLRRRNIEPTLIGLERDPAFVAAARKRAGATIYQCEALCDPPAVLERGADIVIGNPPYMRSIHLGLADDALRSRLRGRYAATSHGEWDLYAAFLEQAIEWTRPGGEVGLVVPSRWMTATFARPLREKLAAAGVVRAVVDFGAAQLFAGATTYISLVFLSRQKPARVEVARFRSGRWQTGRVAPSELSAAPWTLAVGRGRKRVSSLTDGGPRLGEVARIVKGAGTNADPVFVFEAGQGKPAIESALLPLCLRGRDVSAYGSASPKVRCLYPYDVRGALLPFAELADRFPKAARYLESQRARLEARENGRFRGPDFHCFGRPQNLTFHRDRAPKVVFPDVARTGRALLDKGGALVLDSAYAVRPTSATASIELLLAVMNSRAVRLWLLETGVPLRGEYVRLKTAYLASLPLPSGAKKIAAVERAVREQLSTAEIDDLVREAYGLSVAAWNID